MFKNRAKIAATSVLAAAGLALGCAAAPASAADAGLINLMVKTTGRSVYISTLTPLGDSFERCRSLSAGSGWKDSKQNVYLDREVTLTTFTSSNCTDGFIDKRKFSVPASTSAANFWANMS